MKRCPACGMTKPLGAFSLNRHRSDGVQSYCIDCRRVYLRAHYSRHRERYLSAARKRNRRRRDAIRRIIEETKDRPCSDCGIRYPSYVMDFDHRDATEKRFNIGKDAFSLIPHTALLEEIAKCDVVCANCHRERTHGGKY